MTTTSEIDRDRRSPDWLGICFYGTAIVFNLCLVVQVITWSLCFYGSHCRYNTRG
ncbi:hypothetical protein [Fischerella sp. PCC 9605]|uniref:hypothetical protein n=1 Tax=Fischerella sp. PCC 9605 TaxID=1173024 RepID=UPI0012DD395F|nr:hypothetical protein [Fischerella sp. PCC 9605]